MQFSELGLSEKVLRAVEASGYTTPTPIQAQAIPFALTGRDVLGIAQTGTGKTAAFVLPMLSRLEQGRARARIPRTLILEPTRELAAQVEEAFDKYGLQHKLNVALLIGGVSFGDQETKIMRGADVLIATPGRLLDFFERGKLLLTGIEILVIDEADRMLDMGFIPDIEKICKLVPFTRQTLFFSATMPPEITRLTEQFLHNPVRVEVARAATTATTIVQGLVASHGGGDKRETLRRLLREAEDFEERASCSATASATSPSCTKVLVKHGFPAGCLHGDMDQPARMASLDALQATATSTLLVCFRRRRARPRHSRCQPCLQLRRAEPPRGLRPPHRPHGPRRAQRRVHHPHHHGRSQTPSSDPGSDQEGDRLARAETRRSAAARTYRARPRPRHPHARPARRPGGAQRTSGAEPARTRRFR